MRSSDTARVYFSRWLVTSLGVIEDAALVLDASQILFVGTQVDCKRSAYSDIDSTNLGDNVIIPGMINSHVHTNFPSGITLDFEAGSMVSWVESALGARENRSEALQVEDVRDALSVMGENGIVAIGEISNDFLSLGPIVESGMICRFFAERLGFPQRLADDVLASLQAELDSVRGELGENRRVSIHPAPHAPYSTSAKLIQGLTELSELSSIHLAENREEVTLLKDGSGAWRDRLGEIGRDDASWSAPALSPVGYMEKLGVLNSQLLLVHAVQVDDSDLKIIAKSGATVVLCACSNAIIDVGASPLGKFLEYGIPVALGTDSLASCAELDLFAEMRQLHENFPEISSEKIFSLATTGGAAALGLSESLGELKVGTSPGVFAVDLSLEGQALDFKSTEELFDRLIVVGAENMQKLADADIYN